MTSKKTYSIILTALISLSLASPIHAQTNASTTLSDTTVGITASESNFKISKDEAKNIAKVFLKNYFDINIDGSKYQSNVNLIPDYRFNSKSKNYIWQISWSFHDESKDFNINTSVDASTGKIINVDNFISLPGQATGIADLTEDQAKEIGENFLKKVNPKEFSECKLVSNSNTSYNFKGDPTSYNFNYCRMANGIPFSGNYLNVTVDSITGKIRSYNFNWSDLQLPSQDSIISQEKANQAFKDNINLNLKYIPYRDEFKFEDKIKTIKIAYMPDTSSGVKLDAKEGKMLDYDNSDLSTKKEADLDDTQKKSFLESYKPIQKLDKELDTNSAEDIMKTLIKDIYGDGYEIESVSYQDNQNVYGSGRTCWSSNFIKKDSSDMEFKEGGQISIDSLTGQLMSINKFNPIDKFGSSSNSKVNLTWEQAYDRSIEILKKYFSDKIKDIDTKQTYINPSIYYDKIQVEDRFYGFNFSRLVNGISYADDAIDINLSSATGEIANINCRWTENLNVPSSDGTINKDTAQDIFFNNYKPQLEYSLFNENNGQKEATTSVKLVYSLLDGLQYKQLNGVEAFKGNLIDFNGQEIDNNIEAFKEKIKGSSVEKELNILASLGIIDTKNFDLNKQITRTDLIKILVNAKGYRPYMLDSAPALKINYSGEKNDETYKYLQMAVSYGLLDNSGDFKGDELVTREEMIKDIVKLLGYDKLAQAKGIFLLSYSDISDITPDNIGYVAISKGLGLTNDANNKFNPKDKVTISDVAFSVYKALNSLRSNGY